LREKGIVIAFTGLHGQPKAIFERINLLPGLIDEEYSFNTFEECVNWLKPYIKKENLQYLADEQNAEGKSTSMNGT
jgi:SulP family sulfate permease